MRYTSSGAAAAFAICLASLQPAHAQVNDETDAHAFILREAEIKRAQAEEAGAKTGEAAQVVEAEPAKAGAKKTTAKATAAAAAKATKPAVADADASTETAADETKSTDKTAGADKASATDKASRRSAAAATPAAPEGLRAIVARHASANGVPFSLADAIVRVESRYNPRAAHAGNFGLMQIRHQTARGVGYSGSAGGLLDAETNARFGMKYLAQAYKLAGGDTCRTIMKYQNGHLSNRMSGANRTYCAKVHTISARN